VHRIGSMVGAPSSQRHLERNDHCCACSRRSGDSNSGTLPPLLLCNPSTRVQHRCKHRWGPPLPTHAHALREQLPHSRRLRKGSGNDPVHRHRHRQQEQRRTQRPGFPLLLQCLAEALELNRLRPELDCRNGAPA
jgi:hypothetical protein